MLRKEEVRNRRSQARTEAQAPKGGSKDKGAQGGAG